MATRPQPHATELQWPCLRLDAKSTPTRVILDLSIAPNANRTEVVGWHDGALRIRLAAPPVDGAANEALRRWLARQLNVQQSRVELLRGASGRRKQWSIEIDLKHVTLWLDTLMKSGVLDMPNTGS